MTTVILIIILAPVMIAVLIPDSLFQFFEFGVLDRTGSHPDNIETLIIRIGFWGPLCYNYNKDPPKIV